MCAKQARDNPQVQVLNPYYIKARYGEYKQALSKVCTGRKAKYFFEQTGELVKWLKQSTK